jgi:acyl-CoA dehydrogenase
VSTQRPGRSVRSPYFSAEHVAFREHVRAFLDREVAPLADDWERAGEIPRAIWQKLGRAGFLGLHHAKDHGGSQRDVFYSIAFLEELGRTGYAGFRGSVSVHSYMATHYVATAGSDELRRKYLQPAIAGDMIAALAITEPQAGSDLAQIQTTAERQGDFYVVNGTKTFITNGTTADFITLAVRTEPASATARRGATGISLLIVDRQSEGLRSHRLNKVGWHCSDTAELHFENVRVPAANLIGKLNHGFFYIMQGFQLERLAAATLALGGIDRCLDDTRRYMKQRHVFGAPLTRLQALRHRIADLVTEAEATRQLIHHTAWLYQQGELPMAACSMAKLKATELANRTVQECLQLHGGHGYLEGSAIARMYRDSPVGTIAGGASEIMRDLIAQLVLDESA